MEKQAWRHTPRQKLKSSKALWASSKAGNETVRRTEGRASGRAHENDEGKSRGEGNE